MSVNITVASTRSGSWSSRVPVRNSSSSSRISSGSTIGRWSTQSTPRLGVAARPRRSAIARRGASGSRRARNDVDLAFRHNVHAGSRRPASLIAGSACPGTSDRTCRRLSWSVSSKLSTDRRRCRSSPSTSSRGSRPVARLEVGRHGHVRPPRRSGPRPPSISSGGVRCRPRSRAPRPRRRSWWRSPDSRPCARRRALGGSHAFTSSERRRPGTMQRAQLVAPASAAAAAFTHAPPPRSGSAPRGQQQHEQAADHQQRRRARSAASRSRPSSPRRSR